MADVNAHVGERGAVDVVMHDKNGNPTDNWDMSGGVQWSSTNADAVAVVDMDMNPKDADIEFRALTTADTFIECSFDGRVGPDTSRITLRSQSIAVVPGEATGGVVRVRMVPVT